MNYTVMNAFLMLTVFVLIVLLYLINKRKESFDNHDNSTMNSSMNANNESNNTKSNNSTKEEEEMESDEFDLSIESMFEKLQKAEEHCDKIQDRQDIREREEQKRLNEIAKEQFNIQQRKIRELKRIIEYLKKQQKFKAKVNDKCRSATQYKLNTDTQIAKKLAEGGLLDSKKTVFNVELSDKLKEIIHPKTPNQKLLEAEKKETFANQSDQNNKHKPRAPRFTYDLCPTISKEDYVHISKLNKCVGCNPYAVLDKSNYIHKDFN